jgi:hypothetical protein
MVDVTDRPDVAMRLGTFKLCFGHSSTSIASAFGAALRKRGWFTLEKRPCSSQNFWANLALTMPAERLI